MMSATSEYVSTPDTSNAESQIINRILLVEDDLTYVYLCKRYLHADVDNKNTVISASSIEEARVLTLMDSFDCIIVDYRLREGFGTELICDLRDKLHESTPPVIVLTAEEGNEAPVEAIRSGACDFLNKVGMTASALCRAVSNAIELGRLRRANHDRLSELETANILLRKRNEEIQRFYHTVSHEVKTPLTAIQEFVSIVYDGLAGELKEEQKTILAYALESCDQIKNQFNDMLELSRFETGKMRVTLSPCSIYEVFDHCVVAAAPAATEKVIALNVADEPDLPLVMMQRDRIIQVLSNLINNAIKFTDSGGRIDVGCELSADGTSLNMYVRDTGSGISRKDLKRVCERLYQVTPSSDHAGGSGLGLGLSIASEIVKLHGSEIAIESAIGKGSDFSFNLNVVSASDCNLQAPLAA